MIALLLTAAAPTSVPSSAPVTQWPLRILLVLLMLAVIALVLAGMRAGWRRRARGQGDVIAPDLPAEVLADVVVGPVGGVYVGSTNHGDWLDRIVVHDLGVRSRAVAEIGSSGVALRREGARDVFIPASGVRGAEFARGIAGKAYERDGVLVITWDLGGRLVDTGFRADVAGDQRRLRDAILGLVAEQGRAGEGIR
jgi:hypothetical protein